MFKRIFALVLCLALLALSGCSKADNTSSAVESVPEVIVEEEEFVINPLTGVEDLELFLGELRCFVNKENVAFSTLKVIKVLFVCAVFKDNLASVDEGDFFL